jgi:uncharacterized protein (DUF433 family)
MAEHLSRITLRSEQCFGKPCIRGTRMRVVDILEMLAAGTTPEEILHDFDFLEPEDICAALAYAVAVFKGAAPVRLLDSA